MNPARIAIILVAGVAAIALALVVRNMAAGPRTPAPVEHLASLPAQPMTRVLTARTDLAVGDRLSTDDMAWQPWPLANLNGAYISDGQTLEPQSAGAAAAISRIGGKLTDIATAGGPKLQAMVGAIVRDPIYAGEPITAAKIVRGGDSGYMAVRLPPGMRAMSLPVSVDSGAGGFIEPGDRIDVLATHPDTSKSGQGGMITETVLSNVQVLAVDQHTNAVKGGTSLIGATLTLEVPAASADSLARAKAQGNLVMALRSYADIGGGPHGLGSGPAGAIRVFKGGAAAETVTAR
ncbi:MAG TPA: Flp pilus assembly protein CpaB [Caulobacteraceae bacterium]|nr:Flp pilus assembly protein CpaB [Caulobacteraceae bacterium]